MKHPKISVVIPIFNSESTLTKCLSSIINQNYKNLEIICINDGSTDNSLEILKKISKKDSRIKIVNKKNSGYGAAINSGIKKSTGRYLSIVEPDDFIDQGFYLELIKFIERTPNPPDIIKTPYWEVLMLKDGKYRRRHCQLKGFRKTSAKSFPISEASELLRRHPSIWSALYSMDFIKSNNIKFKEYPGAGWADNPFLIDTLCRSNNIIYIDTPFYNYFADNKEQRANFTKNNPTIPLERWNTMTDIIEYLNITDKNILSAHYGRGFSYISDIINNVKPNEQLNSLLKETAKRMNPDIVYSDYHLSGKQKKWFSLITNTHYKNTPDIKRPLYLLKMIIRRIKNDGLINTIRYIFDR